MIDTTKTKALQLLGWYREGSFPALFTDSVSVVKQWMEQGHKVSGVIRHDGLAVAAAPDPSTTAAPPDRDWKAIDAAIDEYLDGYELRLDEGCHTPTEFERFLLSDAVGGLLAEREFLALLTPAPAAGDAQELLGALIEARRELHACQAVIHLAGGFDPAYVRDAQAALKRADAAIAAQQGKGGGA